MGFWWHCIRNVHRSDVLFSDVQCNVCFLKFCRRPKHRRQLLRQKAIPTGVIQSATLSCQMMKNRMILSLTVMTGVMISCLPMMMMICCFRLTTKRTNRWDHLTARQRWIQHASRDSLWMQWTLVQLLWATSRFCNQVHVEFTVIFKAVIGFRSSFPKMLRNFFFWQINKTQNSYLHCAWTILKICPCLKCVLKAEMHEKWLGLDSTLGEFSAFPRMEWEEREKVIFLLGRNSACNLNAHVCVIQPLLYAWVKFYAVNVMLFVNFLVSWRCRLLSSVLCTVFLCLDTVGRSFGI